jgi:hypothetical protein
LRPVEPELRKDLTRRHRAAPCAPLAPR